MKHEMTGVDVHCIVDELTSLVGAKVGKVYQHDEDLVRLTLAKGGRHNLLIQAGRRLHLTQHPPITPVAPQFAMLARKLIQGGRITSISQQGFDRLVMIGIERAGEQHTLVAELFARGNVLLLDEEGRIEASLRQFSYRERSLRTGRQYVLPPPQPDPRELDAAALQEVLRSSEADVVRTLATRAGLGGLYAEEVCALSGIDKHMSSSEAFESKEVLGALESAIAALLDRLEKKRRPHIVLERGERMDCVPVELVRYEKHERQYFDSFSHALDEFFLEQPPEPVEQRGLLERRLESQRRTLARYEEERQQALRKAEALYAHYMEVQRALEQLRASKSAEDIVVDVAPERGMAALLLDGMRVDVLLEQGIEQSAQRYYEQAKKLSRKIEGAKRAIAETERLMAESPRPKRKKGGFLAENIPKKQAWYERFRWFYSSDGFLVIGGRDADTNELIYEKYMEKRDLVLHAQAHGAPLTLIKTGGKDVPESTIHEAAVFAVSYSNVWKAGQYSGECYLVRPEQVSKTPESGEYIPKGSFVIRGRREYHTVPVAAAVGIEQKPLRLIAGPPSAVQKRAAIWFELEPGELMRDDMAKRIYRRLTEHMERGLAKKVAAPERISMALPPGGSRERSEHLKGEGIFE